MRCRTLIAAIVLAWIGIHGAPAAASETTITYQGSLTNDGAPAQGTHAMVFELFTSSVGGSALGTQSAAVEVTNGVFHVELDFGAIPWSLNNDRWLEITVEGFTLTPRQLVTRSPYALATRGIYVSNDGKVGIGRNLASEMLTITDANANILLDNDGSNFGPELILRNRAIDFTTTHGSVVFDNGSELASITYINPVLGPRGLAFSGPSSTHMKILDDGRVGIGSVDPQANLHIDGSLSTHIGFIMDAPGHATGSVQFGSPRSNVGIAGRANNGSRRDIWFMDQGLGLFTRNSDDSPFPSNGVFINDTGDVGIGTIEPADKLHVVGDALIDGTAQVDVLHIVGADLAERFPTTGRRAIEPGTVLEIDPANPGALRVASTPRSTLVAGVVSGANGLPAGTILGNLPGSAGHAAVALSGRVWVKCDAASRAIVPGDMLTTSSSPGHAMPVDSVGRAHGAIIGKAMTALDRGERGLVLVLINLQ